MPQVFRFQAALPLFLSWLLPLGLLCGSPGGDVQAGDWPMWRYDAGRTACSPEELPGELQLAWRVAYSARVPVWDDPLNQDLMPYDSQFEPIVHRGVLVVGFNDTDKVLALDAKTGRELWRFYTDGPVRMPPVGDGGRVYFVSDDGYLYCVSIEDGSLVWKFRGGPADRHIIGNERLISSWPARGGAVVHEGRVYFAASIWPLMGTFLYALDAETGEIIWVNDGTSADFINQPHNYPAFAGVAPQGALAVAGEKLIVPGGRSVPAVFDLATGAMEYYHLAKYGQYGGSSVFADAGGFFAHERDGVFNRYDLKTGLMEGRVRGTQPVIDAAGLVFSGKEISRRLNGELKDDAWKLEVDATGDLIRAGNRMYAGGAEGITALQLSDSSTPPSVAWKQEVGQPVARLLAADGMLFAVTQAGEILAYSGERRGGSTARRAGVDAAGAARPRAPEAVFTAKGILEATQVREGYALFYGVGDGEVLQELVLESNLHVIGIDADAERVAELRRRFDDAGLYGKRIALFAGQPGRFSTPPYMSSLSVVLDAEAAGLVPDDSSALKRIYESLRPYGGVAWIEKPDGTGRLKDAVDAAQLAQAKVRVVGDAVLLQREGALPGAGVWTHQYGNIGNTVKSDDERVKLPLGVLWFGGSSNMDVLPRHGHGPPEQIIGGRLFIEGMDCMSARDVYTGRVLWKVELEKLDNFGTYYDESYLDAPLTLQYNQVHIPGANARGTNFVATLDRVYVAESDQIRVLAVKTGETLQRIAVPEGDEIAEDAQWGYMGVSEDLLIAGAGFAQFSQTLGLPHDQSLLKKSKWRFTDYDKAASRTLVVMDRMNGEELWRLPSRHGFLHNAIVVAGDTLFCLDKLPPNIEQRLARRGAVKPESYRLLAIELATGRVKWETNENVFGTWLGVSAEHGVLVQSMRPSKDTVQGEEGRRMIAYEVKSGKVLWDREMRYHTPPILYHDEIIAGTSRFSLLTGDVQERIDPLTGLEVPWSYGYTKGCNYPIASENLLTFRSSAAAFFDLTTDGGTGHFGGFKSGCTSNLIAADGVLNAPDYTRTCRCSFQNQTSLALVHMPELEIWTHNEFEYSGERVRRMGVNVGAPGDRRDESGTLWMEYPVVGGQSPDVEVQFLGTPTFYRNHSSRIEGERLPWVTASGAEGLAGIEVRVLPAPAAEGEIQVRVASDEDDAEEDSSGAIDLTSSDLELTTDRKPQTVGLRFDKVPIPSGSRIKHAYVQFQVDETHSGPTELLVRGEAADGATAFKAASRNLSARKTTRAAVKWQPGEWGKSGAAGKEQRTPDLAEVLQEIVDRNGWKAGNAVALLITGTGRRTAEAYDGERSGAPLLIVELEEAGENAQVKEASVESKPYTVRLYFAEPNLDCQAGERVFEVALQGQTVIEQFDVAGASGGAQRTLVKEFSGVRIADMLTVEFKRVSGLPPILSGVELIAE